MKFNKILLVGTAVSCLGMAQACFGIIAVTDPAAETNAKGAGNTQPGAQVGDTFNVADGSFASYVPGPGDPTITGSDLNKYQFMLSGTVSSVVGTTVDYTGLYRIFYDSDNSDSYNAGDFSYSSGTLALTVLFSGTGPIYVADGTLTQTAGPSAGFPSAGFPETEASFVGEYIQNLSNPALGTVQGTIESPVPEPTTIIAGAMLLLPFGLSTLRILRRNRIA